MSTAANTASSIEQGQPSARTQVFICYRRNDGDWCAEWLHRHLSELTYTNYQGVASQLRLYYDKTAPGVADWKKLHFPSLQTAHAFLLVCTPGIAKDLSRRGQPDWVYEELRWWRNHRQTAPIVIDTTGEGRALAAGGGHEEVAQPEPHRPDENRCGHGKVTRRPDRRPHPRAHRGTIKQSDHSTVFENLERFKKLNRRLAWALAAAFVLLLAAGVFGFLTTRYSGMAADSLRVAQSRQLAAESEIARSQPGSFVVSSLLGVEALQRAHTPEADRAARSSLKLLPARIAPLKHAARNDHVLHVMNRNGNRVLTWSAARDDDPGTSEPELVIWEVPSGRCVATLPNKKPATAAGISPDGSRVAVAHKDSPVDIWDANTGGRLFEIPKTENATVLAFDPDGRRLAAGGWFPWVTVASLENGDITARIDADAPVLAMEFSPGTPALALGMAPTPEQARNSNYFIYQGLHDPSTLGAIKTAKVFDLARKRWAHQLDHEGAVFALRYSKDGRYLVTACWDGSARVWDTDAGVVFVRFDFPKTVPVTDVAFTPDANSSFLAMAAANDEVVVWDWRKNVEVAKLNDAGVRKVAFSPDGLRLGTSTPTTTRVWAYMPPTELVRMQHASVWFDEPVSFGADGTWLVSGGENGQAWIWSAVNGGANLAVEHSGRIDAVAISPDRPGALLTGGFDGYTRLWDATKGTELFKHLSPSRVHAVAFDATGKRFVSAGGLGDNHGSVRVWTREGFAILWQKEFTTRIWSVALSPDGTLVAAGDGSGIAHVWNLATGELWRAAHGEDMAVHAIAFNADGTLVASGGLDGTVRIWNAPDGKEIRRFQDPSGVLSVAFSGDGQLVAGGTINGDLRVWALRSGKQVLELKTGGRVVDAAFSPDGRAIATASSEGSARIWEVASGRLRMDLPVGEANAISFSPDGHVLAQRHPPTVRRGCSR